MSISNIKKNNILTVVRQLLDQLKIKVNTGTLLRNLKSHPNYPSLLTISDCLTMLKIENNVYRIENELFSLSDLPFPFITYFSENKNTFLLVTDIYEGKLRISNEKHKNISMSDKDFLSSWESVILHAEPNEQSGELNFHQNRIYLLLQKMTIPFFLLSLFYSIYLTFNLNPFYWYILVLCIIKFVGIVITTALVAQSINLRHALIDSVCSANNINSCNALLNSKAAKVTSWLTWSEVGIFYFLSSFLVILIFPTLVPFLFWINTLALPYTLYSISYQYRMKKWCILCCTVQGLLIMELIVFSFSKVGLGFSQHFNLLFPASLCLLIPITIWGLLKPILVEIPTSKKLKLQLNKFRYDSELFNTSLTNQAQYVIDNNFFPIVLGNAKSDTIITIISNPFCSSCSYVHHFFNEWLAWRDDFQVMTILVGYNDRHKKVILHMMALGLLDDRNIVKTAMDEWFNKADQTFEKWAEKHPVVITEQVNAAYTKVENWCEMVDIMSTPTILINGYKLPDAYQLEDLKYLIN